LDQEEEVKLKLKFDRFQKETLNSRELPPRGKTFWVRSCSPLLGLPPIHFLLNPPLYPSWNPLARPRDHPQLSILIPSKTCQKRRRKKDGAMKSLKSGRKRKELAVYGF